MGVYTAGHAPKMCAEFDLGCFVLSKVRDYPANTQCILTFPSGSRGEMRLRGEGLSLNASFYIGWVRAGRGGGHV